MKSRFLAGASALAVAATASFAAVAPAIASADDAYTFGVIGDVPYGEAQVAQFPEMVSELNQQDDLGFVAHVGDIKAGSAQCTDEYFANIKEQFDRFEAPLVYTPGDNEWVDCHRSNNGSYNPLERLATLRGMFFADPGKTLGGTMPVDSQADLGLPENVTFGKNRVAFSVINRRRITMAVPAGGGGRSPSPAAVSAPLAPPRRAHLRGPNAKSHSC